MNEYARSVYADMRPVDRILLFMLKFTELNDLMSTMDERDIRLMEKLIEMMESER